MDDPIKIIFKYKNNNKRVQYHQYVFIGEIDKNIMTILNKMEKLPFYDTLMTLDIKDIHKLEKEYGVYWYNKFFITHHIAFTIDKLNKNNLNVDALKKKMSNEWYSKHIESFDIVNKSILYSYETMIKQEIERKSTRKNYMPVVEEDEDIDFKTKEILSVDTLFKRFGQNRMIGGMYNPYQYGGDDDDSDDEEYMEATEDDLDIDISDTSNIQTTEDSENENDEDEEKDEEEISQEELEQLYTDVDIEDESINKTSDMIKDALNDEKLFKKLESNMVKFDVSKDTNVHDEDLRDIFVKHYVTNQYIFKDDTIKTIKNKICCSVKNNQKFSSTVFIPPSRQYLWSEYYFNNTINKIMIGQRWMKRNELLDIDVEPNSNFRFYEELRKNLKSLRDNIKRFGNKIKREDDENNILYDYENYYSNNEIFMIDVYNEFGTFYRPNNDELTNVKDVYLKIYFPRIKNDDVKYIIDYLNNNDKVEASKMENIYETINNDIILENEVMKMVEDVKKQGGYEHLFKENYITQSVIHVNLNIEGTEKLDLHEIFDRFNASYEYPFIQYQKLDNKTARKMSDAHIKEITQTPDGIEIITKWLENAPYGISFKVRIKERINNKFMAINLNENGRIEYKTQWKEDDMATIEDIKKTYNYVKDLIKEINKNQSRFTLSIPRDEEFKFAFMNTIQKFVLPKDYSINHNNLSEFSRYFFPYIAMVIDPRKRQSKLQINDEKGKFGTYLRYKRVSKYENKHRIEQRILYFIRNYEYTDQALSDVISKQFNITLQKAVEEIERVKKNVPNPKRGRKILKKLENVPKYKPPGIGIDIQGKSKDKYKMRISGARHKEQLDRIIQFMNILMLLYVETYHDKKPEKQHLKEKLKKLSKIAKRRNKVDEIVEEEKEIKTVKQMTQLDKKRIGFKPEKGQNQWTRSCQNSGDDKKRRPQQFTTANINKLLQKGYKLNNKTGMYERKTTYGKNKKEVLLRAVRLVDYDDEGNATGNEVFYTCSPNENGDHMHVGFLTRSQNPHGQCMPCCFKKDHMTSKNKEKREYFNLCIGKSDKPAQKENKTIGDKLYILQDTNKIQQGRLSFLPELLDKYLNVALDKDRDIKGHNLLTSFKGYFFKLGTNQEEYQFLNSFGSIYDLSVDEIKQKLISALDKDGNNQIFTSLNNGDVKTRFETRDGLIDFIKNSQIIDFPVINNLLSIPNVISPNGINIHVFEKNIIKTKNNQLEKDIEKEDFNILCQNIEESYNITDPNRDNIFIIKENKNYYPIIMIIKTDPEGKDFISTKIFKYEDKPNNIVNHIAEFFEKNCSEGILKSLKQDTNNAIAKHINLILRKLDKEYYPRYQVIDARNKCKYIITQNSTIIPVMPSGSLYDVQIIKNMDNQLSKLNDTIEKIKKLYKLSQGKINISPFGVYYDNISNEMINVIAVMTTIYDIIPVIPERINVHEILNKGLTIENKPLYDKIDKEIEKGLGNYDIDERIKNVNYEEFRFESYQLFRLHFSNFINSADNEFIKKRILKIITDSKTSTTQKRNDLRLILYKIIDKDLHDTYNNIIQDGGAERFISIINKLPNLDNYKVVNNRQVCELNVDRESCENNTHCHFFRDKCYMGITKEMAIEFVNRLSEELIEYSLKAKEVLNEKGYYVSQIVNYNKFTERKGQTIIKSDNYRIKNILENLLGKDNLPKIGREGGDIEADINEIKLNSENPIKDMGEFFVQNIVENNNSYFRAFINGFFWIKHAYYDIDSRNLGYYSDHQESLTNYIKSRVIDWLFESRNTVEINKNIIPLLQNKTKKNVLQEYIIQLSNTENTFTDGVVELYIMTRIMKIPIVVIDDNNKIIFVFNNGLKFDHRSDSDKKLTEPEIKNVIDDKINIITIRFSFIAKRNIPDEIEIIYYTK
jgi:hypothetical protein